MADELTWAVTQRTLEGGIHQKLGINPTLYTPYALTAENQQRIVFESHPMSQAPTAKWASVLFYPNGLPAASINRLRVMLWMESFFFPGQLRELECDMTTQPAVYTKLLNAQAPTAPELWILNPDVGKGVKYAPGQDGPPLAELTHAAYVAWVAKNGVPSPGNIALNSDRIAEEALRLKEQKGAPIAAQPRANQ